MLFVSPIFLFAFLPVMLGLYYLLRGKRTAQNLLLFLGSLFFYAWGEYWFTRILVISILFNWFIALIIGKSLDKDAGKGKRSGFRKVMLMLAVTANLGLLFVFKYLCFFVSVINGATGTNLEVPDIRLPIGISFFTFQALSYVVDVYRGRTKQQKNPIYVGLYISLFPQLIAGPIVRYETIEKQIDDRKESFEKTLIGVKRFMQGFTKKVLLANTMAVIADRAFEMTGEGLTMCFAWLGAVAYMLQIYYDFSGYSDMAIGLGKMFGFDFEENFDLPYISASVTEFWRRWHISLSTWFRDYVYIPLGGNRTGKKYKDYRNLFVVWLLTGIWHGANWTFIVWGLVYFLLLLVEKSTPFGGFIEKNRIIGRVYTTVSVMLLWVVFRADNISDALRYIKTMLGGFVSKYGAYNGLVGVYLKENLPFLIAAVLIAGNFSDVMKKLCNKNAIYRAFQTAIGLALFVVSILYMINDTYNPFIYFNF